MSRKIKDIPISPLLEKPALKPCPFCGWKARVMEDKRFEETNHDFPKWAVICLGCGVRTPIVDMATAVKIWNRREVTE